MNKSKTGQHKSKKAKIITLAAVAVVLIATMIAGNIVLASQAPFLHMYFAGASGTDYTSEEAKAALAAGDELVQEVSEGSMVLLRNENDALPLSKDTENRINLFGYNSTPLGLVLTGGGAGFGNITSDSIVYLKDVFEQSGIHVNPYLVREYEAVSGADADENNHKNTQCLQNPGEDFYTDTLMRIARAYSSVAVVVISRNTSENSESGETELYETTPFKNGAYLELMDEERIIFEKLNEYEFEKVIVLLNLSNNMECGFIEDYGAEAALYIGLPGQSGVRAIPKILYGDVSPSGRTADILAYDFNTFDPTTANYSHNFNDVTYAENIYFGYRWYETAAADGYFDDVATDYGGGYDGVVQYPFGYGLDYTDFEWEVDWGENKTLAADGKYEVKVRVTNTGEMKGRDVVQLYVTAPYTPGGIEKAHVSLVAFGKTLELEPNQSQEITLSFSSYDIASYDCYDMNGNGNCGWELDGGDYVFKVMKNSHELADNLASGSAATCTFKAESTILFERDPVTGTEVKNLFTGSTAYDGTPADGTASSSKEEVKANYMSRADGFAAFPKTRTPKRSIAASNTCSVGNDDANNEAAGYKYGEDNKLYLTTTDSGDKPTLDDLNGESGNALKYNTELMQKLRNYKADEWNTLLDQLTKKEILDLISYGGFKTIGVESVSKPRQTSRDGSSGFNMTAGPSADSGKWTAFPAASLIGCSWDVSLSYAIGLSQGAIGNVTGVNGWYAPGVNLHRSPYTTRNYEYYSEDPVLSGTMGAEVIRGAKNNNLYVFIKHFAASESGQNPWFSNTWLTEQALRELYLRPFEIAVKQSKANAVMSSFSNIGKVWSGANHALCTTVLREEWGFLGTVISDYSTPNTYMRGDAGVLSGGADLFLNTSSDYAPGLNMRRFDDNGYAYALRRSAKNILYTFVDTYMAAYDYRQTGETDSRYQVSIDTYTPAAAEFSPTFVSLWAVLDVVLALGIILCVVFIFVPKRKANANAAAGSAITERDDESLMLSPDLTFEDVFESGGQIAEQAPEIEIEREPSSQETETASTEQANEPEPEPESGPERGERIAEQNDEVNEAMREQMAAVVAELNDLTEYMNKLKEADEKKRIAAEKRREANRNKPKKPKAPSQKQQIADMQKEIEELKKLLLK